ncbi:MAG: cupredoxin domain-containing protein [Chloroflexi bacterium]|nr:cupredoxin domain-containing protein [Chloroflexota bacterium]
MKKLLILLLLTSVTLAACSPQATPQLITMETNLMKFQPAMIEVKVGQPVKMTMRNSDSVDHDFSIMEIPTSKISSTAESVAGHDMGSGGTAKEPQLHIAVAMGKSGTLEFTPTKPGTYEFFCTVAGHKEAGMKGTLVVK